MGMVPEHIVQDVARDTYELYGPFARYADAFHDAERTRVLSHDQALNAGECRDGCVRLAWSSYRREVAL